jgi:hypothetical protein
MQQKVYNLFLEEEPKRMRGDYEKAARVHGLRGKSADPN